jgi:hypothetical protein
MNGVWLWGVSGDRSEFKNRTESPVPLSERQKTTIAIFFHAAVNHYTLRTSWGESLKP